MRKNLQFGISLSVIVLLLSVMSFAQKEQRTSATGSKYVISAEAGGINYVDGKVMVSRGKDTSGYLLKGDSISVGDQVTTGADGKAEVLLNPGSFARLGGNSSFEFVNTSLENLQIKLDRGSAMFEVVTTEDFSFIVKTPKADFSIIKTGIYRIDVLEDGTGKIEVWKGKAQIGDDEDAKIKKGRTATVDGDDVAVVKFDRDEKDSLEEWSKSRSKEIAKANSSFQRERLRNSLISSFGANRWNLYDSFGVWVYDPFWGGYSFLPFWDSWYSPYGYRYSRDLWYCRLPRYIYYQPPPGNTTQNPNPRQNPSTISREQSGQTTNPRSSQTRRPEPPFRGNGNPNPNVRPSDRKSNR